MSDPDKDRKLSMPQGSDTVDFEEEREDLKRNDDTIGVSSESTEPEIEREDSGQSWIAYESRYSSEPIAQASSGGQLRETLARLGYDPEKVFMGFGMEDSEPEADMEMNGLRLSEPTE